MNEVVNDDKNDKLIVEESPLSKTNLLRKKYIPVRI